MTNDTEIRAANARQILDNPMFNEAFDNVREVVISQIEAAPLNDSETRNQMGLQLSALAGVKADLKSHLDTVLLDADESTE